jgi:hypothetical protein
MPPPTLEELEKARVFEPIAGDPPFIQRTLTELAATLDADELLVVTNVGDHALRRRSYELLAELFALNGGRPAPNQPLEPVV